MGPETTSHIAYGKERIRLDLDRDLAEWQVIKPRHEPPLAHPHEAFLRASRSPIECRPLCEVVKRDDHVVIVTSDGTRPVPNHVLIPWILGEIPAAPERVTVLIGTGTHRPNTDNEIRDMFGPESARGSTL